jgi:hypothetical protein
LLSKKSCKICTNQFSIFWRMERTQVSILCRPCLWRREAHVKTFCCLKKNLDPMKHARVNVHFHKCCWNRSFDTQCDQIGRNEHLQNLFRQWPNDDTFLQNLLHKKLWSLFFLCRAQHWRLLEAFWSYYFSRFSEIYPVPLAGRLWHIRTFKTIRDLKQGIF